MKKLLVALLTLALIFTFAACSSNNGGDTQQPDNSTDTQQPDNSQEPATNGDNTDPYADIQETTVKIGITIAWSTEDTNAAIWAMHRMEEYWLENSGGKVKVEVYDNSVLGGDEAMLEAISQGTLTMTYPASENLVPYHNDYSILSLPWLFTSINDIENALDNELGAYLNKHLDGTGILPVDWYFWGARDITNNVRPINEPADLKGIKMRVMNSPTCIDMYQTLGANPTPMSWGEVFMGLQQGTVEGQENPASTVYAAGFQDVQKYYSRTNHIYGFCSVVLSESWFNGLNEATQNLILQGINDMCDTANQRELEMEEENINLLREAGMEINSITPENQAKFVEAIQPMYDKYYDQYDQELWDIINKYKQ